MRSPKTSSSGTWTVLVLSTLRCLSARFGPLDVTFTRAFHFPIGTDRLRDAGFLPPRRTARGVRILLIFVISCLRSTKVGLFWNAGRYRDTQQEVVSQCG